MGLAGLIMSALGWQAVGVGMAAKGAYDLHKSNQSYRAKERGYAPAAEWWDKYGMSRGASSDFIDEYLRGTYREMVLGELKAKVKTDVPYVKHLISTGGYDYLERQDVCMLYQALHGRAMRLSAYDLIKFPNAGRFDYRHPEIKEVFYELFRNAGVPDSEKWFCESKQKQCAMLGVSPSDYQ